MIKPPDFRGPRRRRNLISGRSAAIITIGIASVFGWSAYNGHQNSKSLDDTLADLDNRPSVVFNSLAACSERFDLQSCQASQSEALRIAGQNGTTLSYKSGQSCATRHNNSCREEVRRTRRQHTDIDGNYTRTSYNETRTYYPAVVGWQAARDNLEKAVPLYHGPDDSTMVRKDGKVFMKDRADIRPSGPS